MALWLWKFSQIMFSGSSFGWMIEVVSLSLHSSVEVAPMSTALGSFWHGIKEAMLITILLKTSLFIFSKLFSCWEKSTTLEQYCHQHWHHKYKWTFKIRFFLGFILCNFFIQYSYTTFRSQKNSCLVRSENKYLLTYSEQWIWFLSNQGILFYFCGFCICLK